MPISNAAFVRSTLILLLAGMVALLGIVGMSLWLTGKVQTYFAELVEVRAVRSAAADLFSTMLDAETGQRGFVITGIRSSAAPMTRPSRRSPSGSATLPDMPARGRNMRAASPRSTRSSPASSPSSRRP